MVEEEEKTKQEDIVDSAKAKSTYTHVYPSKEDVTIFDPRNVSDYLRTYPELKTIPEFVNISISELKFVWWYANPTSPLVKTHYWNPALRANKAYCNVWDYHTKSRDEIRYSNFCSLRFSEPVRLAIEVMSKMDYNTRYRARQIVDSTFKKYEELSNLTASNFADASGIPDYVKYANVLKMVITAMPDLIKIKEQGFGIVEKSKKKSESESGEMYNEFLEEQS